MIFRTARNTTRLLSAPLQKLLPPMCSAAHPPSESALQFSFLKGTDHQQNVSKLIHTSAYSFAKISKKEQEKKKDKLEKDKVKEELGDTSTFDLNPIEEDYEALIESFKAEIQQYKVGRLDQSFFQNIYVKIGNQNIAVKELAEIAPKNANTVVLNPYDNDNLDAIHKGVQAADLGFQLTRVEKTIVVNQPPNSMKELKEKMSQRLKKATEAKREKFNNVRVSARDELKKYKKVVSEDRIKQIQTELKSMHEKFVQSFDKLAKDKEKELQK